VLYLGKPSMYRTFRSTVGEPEQFTHPQNLKSKII
jgi:hypothetical protein